MTNDYLRVKAKPVFDDLGLLSEAGPGSPLQGCRADPRVYTLGRCADGALSDMPGEFKVEYMKILVQSQENLINII